jgi:hypothetical protein
LLKGHRPCRLHVHVRCARNVGHEQQRNQKPYKSPITRHAAPPLLRKWLRNVEGSGKQCLGALARTEPRDFMGRRRWRYKKRTKTVGIAFRRAKTRFCAGGIVYRRAKRRSGDVGIACRRSERRFCNAGAAFRRS